MRALTIKQPWAYAILKQGKNVENRTWVTSYRGPLVIHAGIALDREAVTDGDVPGYIPGIEGARTGGIVGIVDLVDCLTPHQAAKDPRTKGNDWWNGDYAWILENPRILPYIPYKGSLSVFKLPEDVIAEINEALEEPQ